MTGMNSIKGKNIAYSLIILAVWSSFVLIASAKADANPNSGSISAFYFWAKLTSLAAGFGGLTMLTLRIFRKIDRYGNFFYTFFGTANTMLGMCGITFYYLKRINSIGLCDLLPNLLIGAAIMIDLFFFESLFKAKGPG